MIRKLFFTLFLFGLLASNVYGKDTLAYKSKFQIKALAGGANLPITKLTQGTSLDYLLLYNDYSYYWQMIPSLSYFFNKRWGLEVNMQAASSEKLAKRPNNFYESMKFEYGDKYYVHSFSTDYNYSENILIGSITKCNIGVIYRFERNKFFVYPKFSIGMISFSTDQNSIYLKEKGSNNEYKVSYSSQKKTNHYLTLAPSASLGYKILRFLYFHADITLSYFKTNIEFKKDITNLYTNESTVEYFDYKKDIFTLSLGAGLIFIIH